MKLANIKLTALAIAYAPIMAIAKDVDDVFGDVETKGNLLVNWFTSGFFAFAVVAMALVFVIIGFLQGRIEWTRGIVIVVSSIALGQIPKIAMWLIN